MVNVTVWFNATRLPSRAQWEVAATEQGVPIRFAESFEPATHPMCGRGQVDHPEGVVVVSLGDAPCRFQLDLYENADREFPGERDRAAVAGCDRSAAFRWSESSLADALAAQIAAGALAVATDGMVPWPRAKGGWCRGAQAFGTLRRAAYREVEKVLGPGFAPTNPFGPAVEVTPLDTGWLQCPRCERRFSPQSERNWDGDKHLTCGQVMRVRK